MATWKVAERRLMHGQEHPQAKACATYFTELNVLGGTGFSLCSFFSTAS